jgi:hypothetical protein
MARRRLEQLGRMALQVALDCQRAQAPGESPLVFASRYGDLARSLSLLNALAKDEPLSPAGFALSVHNSIGAQYSMLRGDTGNVVAVANGLFTLEAAVLEAAALLHQGHPEVLVVLYEATPPSVFLPYDEPASDFAFAWALTRGAAFSLETVSGEAPAAPPALPHALEILKFFLSAQAEAVRHEGGAGWRWRRHA